MNLITELQDIQLKLSYCFLYKKVPYDRGLYHAPDILKIYLHTHDGDKHEINFNYGCFRRIVLQNWTSRLQLY